MKYIKLKELVTINPENINKNYPYNSIKYLDTANITNGKIDTIVEINIKDIPSRAKRIVKQNDIVYSTVRPNLCHYGLLRDVEENLIVSTGFVVIRCNLDKVLPEYLYAYLTLPEITIKLHSIAETSTSAYPSIKPSDIENLEIPLPTIEEQKRISKILSVLDLKMNLNTKTNDNLYKILEQYIKEHYYNNEFVRNGNVNDIGKIQGGYAFKSKDLLNETTNNKVLKIKNISASGVDIDNTQCVYDEVANKVDKKFLLLRGNVIIAMTGAELGKTGYLYGQDYRYFLNQRVGVIRGNDKYSELYLNCLFILNDMQNTLNSKGYGSAQPNISTSDIENIEIPIPKEDELETFYEKCNPIYSKMILNSEQNQSLTQLRDTLLPKLMNGEIDLDKIEI